MVDGHLFFKQRVLHSFFTIRLMNDAVFDRERIKRSCDIYMSIVMTLTFSEPGTIASNLSPNIDNLVLLQSCVLK
jgi:hypothetical protein